MVPAKRFHTAEELETAVNKYFNKCEKDGSFPSQPGMLLALNISPDTYARYEKNEDNKYPGFAEVLKKAELVRENWLCSAVTGPTPAKNLAALIFLLKQSKNGGYIDKPIVQAEDVKINVKINCAGTEQFD